jgi:L,D-transpeptidase catalytic domain
MAADRMSGRYGFDSAPRRHAHSWRVRHRATLPAAGLLAGLLLAVPAGPAAAQPARDPDVPTLLLRVRHHERVRLHRRPGGRVVAILGDRTEFGSRTVLTVLARRGSWAQVSAAVLGGRRAWLRIDGHVARRGTRWELLADISARSLQVFHDGRLLHDYRVAVGAAISPTPTGRFQVTDKLRGRKFGASYGCCILALSTNQPHPPPGWTGMARMAVHGTDAERAVGDPVSAGCLHAHAAAMRWLMRHVPVGTPVELSR